MPLDSLEQTAERTIVLLAIAGDDNAFRELVLRHQSRVRSFLRRVCGNATQADDLAQAVFLKAWRNIQTVRNPDTFAAWLKRIALHAAIDARRKAGPTTEPLEGDDVLAAASTGAASADARLDLEAALARLSFPARTCVLLFHGEGMSHAEISAETGLPIGTVKSHIARATALLRAWLGTWRQNDG